MVATPTHTAGGVDAFYEARDDLQSVMDKNGLVMRKATVRGDSCVSRARNTLVDEFFRSDCTHLLFIDSDIGFTPADVLALLILADPASDKDVIGGLYPKKHIRWDKVHAAVQQGLPADDLENFVGDMVFNPTGVSGSYDLYSPLEVSECGTGFLMIQRHVFEKFKQSYPELAYRIDHHGKNEWSHCFFDNEIDPVSKRFLTEDYNFCRLIRNIGLKVWVAPWLNLDHYGNYRYVGNPGAVSSLSQPQKELKYG